MNNPYTVGTPEFTFYTNMTHSIEQWMLNKYPEFDNSLIHKMRNLGHQQEKLNDLIRSYESKLKINEENFVKKITDQINDFLSKEYPDIDNKLSNLVKKLEKNEKLMEEKLKTVVKSDSLYEDVYKMRDDFKEMKKFMDGFSKKIKKAFEV